MEKAGNDPEMRAWRMLFQLIFPPTRQLAAVVVSNKTVKGARQRMAKTNTQTARWRLAIQPDLLTSKAPGCIWHALSTKARSQDTSIGSGVGERCELLPLACASIACLFGNVSPIYARHASIQLAGTFVTMRRGVDAHTVYTHARPHTLII